ncbi:M23 family metallopeptidase [Microbacterium sp. LWO13-1.2]|uniref:M23 family metallopeptidase n=1 Tax=Microbacterium sp. LWO13-1.2 TaxID=3135262 RepID=UPI003139B0D7
MSPPLPPEPDGGSAIHFDRRGLFRGLGLAGVAVAVGVESTILNAAPAAAASATVWPNGTTTRPTISDDYGTPRPDGRVHRGTDFVGFSQVRAVSAGTVKVTGTPSGWGAGGIQVWIEHDDGYLTRSLHLASYSIGNEQRVAAGQQIGVMGNTPPEYGYGVHLHLEVVVNGVQIDPVPFLTNRVSGLEPPLDNSRIHQRNNNMASLYYSTINGVTTFALAGDGVGNAAWLETTDQALANQLAAQHGNAAYLTPGSFNQWKGFYKGQ